MFISLEVLAQQNSRILNYPAAAAAKQLTDKISGLTGQGLWREIDIREMLAQPEDSDAIDYVLSQLIGDEQVMDELRKELTEISGMQGYRPTIGDVRDYLQNLGVLDYVNSSTDIPDANGRFLNTIPGMTTYVLGSLSEVGITQISHLSNITREGIYKLSGMGKTRVQTLETVLAEAGFQLDDLLGVPRAAETRLLMLLGSLDYMNIDVLRELMSGGIYDLSQLSKMTASQFSQDFRYLVQRRTELISKLRLTMNSVGLSFKDQEA